MDGLDRYMREMYGEPEGVPPTPPIDSRWYNIAREYFPGATDDEIGFVLWNCTSYPIGPKGNQDEYIHKQLKIAAAGECEELPLRKSESARDA
jgi:hypothetical protein